MSEPISLTKKGTPRKHRVHQRPDEVTLRHQCEVEHIPISTLRVTYGYKSVTDLYVWCKRWGITPYCPPDPYDGLRQIQLTPDQHQVLLGTLLGDGNCLINHQRKQLQALISLTQGAPQRDYLEWKKKWLMPFFPQQHVYEYEQQNFNPGAKVYIYRSIAHPAFTEYRRLLYPNEMKRISPPVLERLQPLGIAVWLMDDGSYEKRSGWINLATHSFPKEDNELAAEWFSDLLGTYVRVYPLRRLNQWFLAFNRPAVKMLRQLVQPHFYTPLLYKLGFPGDEEQSLQPLLIPRD